MYEVHPKSPGAPVVHERSLATSYVQNVKSQDSTWCQGQQENPHWTKFCDHLQICFCKLYHGAEVVCKDLYLQAQDDQHSHPGSSLQMGVRSPGMTISRERLETFFSCVPQCYTVIWCYWNIQWENIQLKCPELRFNDKKHACFWTTPTQSSLTAHSTTHTRAPVTLSSLTQNSKWNLQGWDFLVGFQV